MSAKLVDARSNQEYPLKDGVTTVGRAPENDVVLPARSVSRFHAEIRRERDSWVIADHGSTCGTFVNGVKVEGSAVLRDGDALRLGVTAHLPEGAFNLVFRAGAGSEGLAARLKRAARAIVERRKVDSGRMVFERGGGLLVVRLEGIFRKPEVDELAAGLRRELAERPLHVALDLTAVSHLNSYGLAVLVEMAAAQRERGRELRAFGASGTVHKILLMPGAGSPIRLCADEPEALKP